jgi:hypothetical protein
MRDFFIFGSQTLNKESFKVKLQRRYSQTLSCMHKTKAVCDFLRSSRSTSPVCMHACMHVCTHVWCALEFSAATDPKKQFRSNSKGKVWSSNTKAKKTKEVSGPLLWLRYKMAQRFMLGRFGPQLVVLLRVMGNNTLFNGLIHWWSHS